MGVRSQEPTELKCDNQSCMAIAKNPVFHAHKKHIEIQYHYVRELMEDGVLELHQIRILLTKALPKD